MIDDRATLNGTTTAYRNEICKGAKKVVGDIRISCDHCAVQTLGAKGCYSVFELSEVKNEGGCILHLCLPCAAPYLALDALRT